MVLELLIAKDLHHLQGLEDRMNQMEDAKSFPGNWSSSTLK